ncbi:hypothetical protein CJU89_0744 [Yarrowia sp. B02]|nr:hypothetical protein CJU89_0744 [Yarrowia sp. B02]
MSEIEELVESLYVPRNADEIKETQRQLQAQQRGPHGWEMARQLLRSNSSNSQFFGALTYAVQINARADSGNSGTEDDQRQVVSELLSWLVGIRSRAEGKAFVVQKLLSVITLAFQRYPYAWRAPLNSVIGTITTGEVVLDVPNGNTPQINNAADLQLILLFAKTLAEDLSRPGGFVGQDMKMVLRGIIEDDNMDAIMALLKSALQQGMGLDCFNSWVVYGCTSDGKKILERLSELNDVLLPFIQTEQLFEESAKLVYDVLESWPTYFSRAWKTQLMDLYMGEWGQNTWQQFAGDIDTHLDAAEWYVKLLRSVCDSYSDHVLALMPTQKLAPGGLMALLLKLSEGVPGLTPIEDENMSSELLEYWMGLLDTLYDNQGKMDSELVDGLLLQVASIFWSKMRLPDLTESTEMKEFRRDVGDLLESVCSIVPVKLLQNLAGIVTRNIAEAEPDWPSVEAALHGLIAVADSDDDNSAAVVCKDPALLQKISQHPSVRLRKTAITFVGVFDSKYVHGPCLGSALDFLFASLAEPSLSLFASRSISKLCSDGRKSLGPMLASFFQVYEQMVSGDMAMSSYCHENTVEGIAAIIESEPSIEKQSEYLSRLIDILIDRSQKEMAVADTLPDDPIVSLFKCLICIGKKLQSIEEVDLDASNTAAVSAFWQSDPNQAQQKLLHIITTFAIQQAPYNTSVEICDLACLLFRKGFSEEVGPFVFSTQVIFEFISTKFNQGPEFAPKVVNLASCYLTSSTASASARDEFTKEIVNLFFAGSNSILNGDDDMAHDVLGLVEKIASTTPELFFVHTPEPLLHAILSYAVSALASSQILVISNSTSLWTNFCTLKLQGDAKERHLMIMKALGPSLINAIMMKVCGDATRSSLSYYSSVLRKYIFKFPMDAKHNIEQFFNNPETKPPKASDQDVKTFVAKLVNLRGQKLTDSVVKEFWVTCSGSGLDYIV